MINSGNCPGFSVHNCSKWPRSLNWTLHLDWPCYSLLTVTLIARNIPNLLKVPHWASHTPPLSLQLFLPRPFTLALLSCIPQPTLLIFDYSNSWKNSHFGLAVFIFAFHFLIAGLPLCSPFPPLFYTWFQNPKSLIMGSLPLLTISTFVLPPKNNCNP